MHPTARTAIARSGPSAPAKKLYDKGLITGKVLDYGSGRGADVKWLRGRGLNVAAYDPHHGPKKAPTGPFDTILCTYVLNVLNKANQDKVAAKLRGLLAPGGSAYVTVRRDTCGSKPASGVQSCVRRSWPVVASSSSFQTYKLSRAGRANRRGQAAKKIGSKTWVARSALSLLPMSVHLKAEALGKKHKFKFDLVRYDSKSKSIMLGRVPGLGTEPVPELLESLTWWPGGRVRKQKYADPPVYHRTEAMLLPTDPRRGRLAGATLELESQGLLSRPDIGRRSSWKKARKKVGAVPPVSSYEYPDVEGTIEGLTMVVRAVEGRKRVRLGVVVANMKTAQFKGIVMPAGRRRGWTNAALADFASSTNWGEALVS